ncbi:DinB family protein [Longimicrobium terrae]|uniref:Putative damage-inducible protein DinB n=1 Tax=Longimicrobium terrae TaxID=1639882 RepID=A0A841GWT9_9BACT|nr:DinB family protein [Longimicrobium terrae]MBB4634204.1 putative damage-inducible protein DinB [Longimicrobium terrae]MBB6068906.1 putative damage-inducible protein DinB [Longimicrobium terrae]NNC28086.1 DinB family protein [Longimicrobium terrae]
MTADESLRDLLARQLDWQDAHATFDAAVDGVPAEHQGTRPAGLPHSAWELLEHLRITQRDILDFCRDPGYQEMAWPDDYWPASAAPPSPQSWEESAAAYRADRATLKQLAADPATDLYAPIPHGSGQTILRELLLVVDHTAYHVGQLILVRQLLGIWK